jgi:hypothetical protein
MFLSPLVFESLESFVVFQVNFFVLFYVIARFFVPSASPRLWIRLAMVISGVSLAYGIAGAVFGGSLLSVTGLTRIARFPQETPEFFANLSVPFLTFFVGLSLCQNGLMMVALGYLPQRYAVRLIHRVLRLIYKRQVFFFQINAPKKNLPVVWHTLWLMLLPVPLQYALMMNVTEVVVINALYLFPAVLAMFIMWGLRAAPLVGMSEESVLRGSEVVASSLFWFTAMKWITLVAYVFVAQELVASAVSIIARAFARALIIFGPPAICVVYFYVTFLENRVEAGIVEYLSKKERLEQKTLTIRAD